MVFPGMSSLCFVNDYVYKTCGNSYLYNYVFCVNDVDKEEYCGCLKCHCDFFHNGRKDLR